MNNTLDERKAIMVLISQVQALRDTIQSTLYNSTAQEHIFSTVFLIIMLF